jgi:DNA-nicking Smr family endonuclease
MTENSDQPIEYPIDGTLDLHQFAPKDTKDVVLEYIKVCLEKNIMQIRIVHGKGIGVKREIVHSLLENHPNVKAFRHESGSGGSWGATVVDLKNELAK